MTTTETKVDFTTDDEVMSIARALMESDSAVYEALAK